jgi:hypothetical protein
VAKVSPDIGKNGPRFGLDSAEALAVKVSCVVAAAPAAGVTVVGLNVQVTPAGCPEQAKLTAELKPFCGVTVKVVLACPPDEALSDVGEAPNVNVAGKLMVKVALDAPLFT